MNSETKTWLKEEFQASDENIIETFLKNSEVSSFLIIWTLFEQRIFGGFFKIENLKKYAADSKNTNPAENTSKYFHERYQDEKKYKNLTHGKSDPDFKLLLNKKWEDLSSSEKLYLSIFVVYRYRNNIFHGNKGVTSWTKYKDVIEKCCDIMVFALNNKKTIDTIDSTTQQTKNN